MLVSCLIYVLTKSIYQSSEVHVVFQVQMCAWNEKFKLWCDPEVLGGYSVKWTNKRTEMLKN